MTLSPINKDTIGGMVVEKLFLAHQQGEAVKSLRALVRGGINCNTGSVVDKVVHTKEGQEGGIYIFQQIKLI